MRRGRIFGLTAGFLGRSSSKVGGVPSLAGFWLSGVHDGLVFYIIIIIIILQKRTNSLPKPPMATRPPKRHHDSGAGKPAKSQEL